jgi:hypothetical protein
MNATIALLLLAAAPQQNGHGRPDPSRPQAPQGRSSWSAEWRAEAGLAFDSNPFLLDGGQKDRMERDLPADQTSGRWDDMESVEDIFFAPDFRLEAGGPSPLGRKLRTWIDLEYPYYFQNPRRSHLDLGLGVGQSVGNNGQIELSLEFTPEFFRKNYLADAVDSDGDGDIDSDERRYQDGTYREWETEVAYRHKIVDRTAQKPFGLEGAVAAGLRDRSFDPPFDGRNEEGVFLKLGLQARYGKPLKAGLHYKYETIDSPVETGVVLINEVALGRNVNGDAFITDDARTVTSVDRSRTEHTIGVSFGYELSPAVELEVSLARLLRDWESSEPLDFSHTDRQDTRDEVGLALNFAAGKGWDGRVGWEWREQHTDRPDDPGGTGDTVDYKRNLFFVSFVYRW